MPVSQDDQDTLRKIVREAVRDEINASLLVITVGAASVLVVLWLVL